jgi:hypothetical protein
MPDDNSAPSPPPLIVAPKSGTEGDVTGGLIPYKNPHALISYYFGIFSLIPFIGFICGLVAVPLGISGLRARKIRAEVRGAVHAWIGIVLGSISAAIHICVGLLILAGIATSHRRSREVELVKVKMNLNYIEAVAYPYFRAHPGARAVSVRDLRVWFPGEVKIQSVAGEQYDTLVIPADGEHLSIKLPDGRIVEYEKK